MLYRNQITALNYPAIIRCWIKLQDSFHGVLNRRTYLSRGMVLLVLLEEPALERAVVVDSCLHLRSDVPIVNLEALPGYPAHP